MQHPTSSSSGRGSAVWARVGRALGVVAILLPLTVRCGGQGFREDEIACLRAVDKIASCCPDLPVFDVVCTYHEGGGCESEAEEIQPALTVAQARCVEDSSCGALVQQGVCAALRPSDEPLNAAGAAGAGGSSAGFGGSGGAGGDVAAYQEEIRLRTAIERRPVCR